MYGLLLTINMIKLWMVWYHVIIIVNRQHSACIRDNLHLSDYTNSRYKLKAKMCAITFLNIKALLKEVIDGHYLMLLVGHSKCEVHFEGPTFSRLQHLYGKNKGLCINIIITYS